MTNLVPWQQRLSTGTEDIQDEVVRVYQQTRHSKAYVPTMIWGTLQTEAYATVILRQVVNFLGVPDDVPAGVEHHRPRPTRPHSKAFSALSNAASYGNAAEKLISKALAFWGRSAAAP